MYDSKVEKRTLKGEIEKENLPNQLESVIFEWMRVSMLKLTHFAKKGEAGFVSILDGKVKENSRLNESIIGNIDYSKIKIYFDGQGGWFYCLGLHKEENKKSIGSNYFKVFEILKDMGWLIVDDRYFKTLDAGITKSYIFTKPAVDAVENYFKCRVAKITKEDREVFKKRAKRRGYFKDYYGNILLDEVKKNIDSVADNMDISEIIPRLEKLRAETKEKTPMKKLSNLRCIENIFDRNYKELSFNKKTGRVYNPLNNLSLPIRKALKPQGLPWALSIDARSEVPTMLAKHLRRLNSEPSEAFLKECSEWESVFCADESPRKKIALDLKEMGEGEISEFNIKKGLNIGLNGGMDWQTVPVRKWFKEKFPEMHRVWWNSSRKDTVSQISREFERPIFRSCEVYQRAIRSGLTIIDCHDEIMIYGDIIKARKFANWFINRAKRVSGIGMQFKIDINAELVDNVFEYRQKCVM